MPDKMDIDPQTSTTPQQPPKKKNPSSTRELTTLTIKSPPFAYVHLTTSHTSPATIDPLSVRSYCTAALRQFLGETGSSILPDILHITRNTIANKTDIFLRLPREDLAAFAAAITAFAGDENSELLLQVVACGDWLGSLIGKGDECGIWGV